jgi:hypothetical protein
MTERDATQPETDAEIEAPVDEQRLPVIEGADRGALGLGPPPEPAPEGASVDPSEHLVPGAGFADRLPTEAKPWFSSLAADSHQAGVSNDPSDAQDAAFPAQAGESQSGEDLHEAEPAREADDDPEADGDEEDSTAR